MTAKGREAFLCSAAFFNHGDVIPMHIFQLRNKLRPEMPSVAKFRLALDTSTRPHRNFWDPQVDQK